jgi:D-3-phosphoglycerate dehydrogenase
MLSAIRQFGANHRYIQQGHWGMGVPLDRMFAMHTMTVGIVGCGRIGSAVAARLQPFNCRVVAFDPIVAEADIKAAGCEPVSLEEIWAMSDLITLHCPSNRGTENLVAAGAIEQMKQGVILVNCARGTIVNTHDLVAALESGKVGFAALDVVAPEPLPADHPLRTMENVLINSHLAVSTVDCIERLRRNVAEIVACSVRGEPLPNIVNGVTPAVEG